MAALEEAEMLVSALGEVHLPQVAIVPGSLRDGLNLRFAREAREILSEQANTEIVIPDLPLFSQGYERESGEPWSPAGREFRARMRRADALLVVSPEYDRLPSAIILNACHWLSRQPEPPLRGKKVMLAGVSSGSGGTQAARPALRTALERIGAEVLGEEFFVPRGGEVFSDEEKLLDLRSEMRHKLPSLLGSGSSF